MVQPSKKPLWTNLEISQRNRPAEPGRRTTTPSTGRALRTAQKRSQEESSSSSSTEERGRKIRRTDHLSSYYNPENDSPSTSSVGSRTTIYIASDTEEEEQKLNREICDLYQQIKIKKERIEKIRIERAVRKRELEIRRETRRWLPTLNSVDRVRNEIINNISSDSDSDDDIFEDFPSAEELLQSIIDGKDNNSSDSTNKNNNTSNLDGVD